MRFLVEPGHQPVGGQVVGHKASGDVAERVQVQELDRQGVEVGVICEINRVFEELA